MAPTFFLGLVSDVWQWDLLPCSVDQRQNCCLISFFSTSSLSPRSSPLFSNRRKDGLGGAEISSVKTLSFVSQDTSGLFVVEDRTLHFVGMLYDQKKNKKTDDFKKFKQKIIWGGKLLHLIN